MSQLRTVFEGLGLLQVATFIASGNVVFTSETCDPARLEDRLSTQLESSLGCKVDTFVRTAVEVVNIGARRLFDEDGKPGITIHVAFFQRKLSPDIAGKLAAVRTPTDEFRVDEREFYWLCRTRLSDSKVWTLPQVKALPLPTSTMRNMTTIRKLIAKHLA